MESKLLHVFRNSPFGRETLMQSLYFCNKAEAYPVIYIPRHSKFLMYFENDVVQVDLDNSYLRSPDTALAHATELVKQSGLEATFFEPKNFTASTLPDVPTDFDFMCCPRVISDLSTRVGLGHIGPKVRRIVRSSRFPVLITSPVFKPWQSIAVFFGGSANAVKALRLGFRIHQTSGLPLRIFTQAEEKYSRTYEQIIKDEGLEKDMDQYVEQWHIFEGGNFVENLYDVPHDALVVLGAYGHGVIRELVFGSKMEKIQATIGNNLLIAGPNY